MKGIPIMISPTICPNILMDVDDVICDTNTVLLQLMNEFTGITKTMDEFTDHDLTKVYPNTTKQHVYDVIMNSDLFTKALPITGCIEALNALMNAGYNIHFCTARNHLPGAKEQTESWFQRHNIPNVNDILYTNYGEPKSSTYKSVHNKYAYIFDDGPFNIDDALQSQMVIKPVLIEHSWNQSYDHPFRAKSLFQFCKQHGLIL